MILIAAEAGASHTNATVLLIELGAILLVLSILGRLARLLHFPAIPFYLIAGLFFGRGGFLPLASSTQFIETAAEIGVILLLLMLGLEYTPTELRSSLRTQAPIGLFDGAANALPGLAIGVILGWSVVSSIALAGITWVSSSGVVAKTLSDYGRLGNRETPAILGVLVIEDLAMALYLPLLTALLAHSGADTTVIAVVIAVAAISIVLIVATRFSKQITALVASEDAESLLLGILGLTLLVAGLADELKVSAAVGAFLVGIAISGTVAHTVTELLTPLRDLFAAAFFVFFGLSTNPKSLPAALPLAILLTVIVVGTKMSTGYLAARRIGVGRRARWRAAVALIPHGEFSVVVAALAVSAGEEARIGPITACFVLLTIGVGAVVQRLPDRLRPDRHAPVVAASEPVSEPTSAS